VQRIETPVCLCCSLCRRTDEANSPGVEPCESQQAIPQRTVEARTGADHITLSDKGERRE